MALFARKTMMAVLFVFCPQSVMAQNIAAGERVAQTSCSSCHEIGIRPTQAFSVAPPFRSISRTRGMTQTSIVVFLKTPHEIMPNYVLSEKQISDVAAYIIDLRSKFRPSPTTLERRSN